jgi:dTDP-4-dehydrorhamnose 3,5-epimerase
MEITKGEIEGIFIIEPRIFEDDRGYFFEAFKACDFVKQVCECRFVQENEAKSSYGVVRGLHYQLQPHAQSKLVRVIKGRIIDVAVDIRKGSPTYGEHVAVELTEDNHRQLFIPRGFAHGFVVLSESAIFQYKCDNFYAPTADGGINIKDENLCIDWQIPTDNAILSEKDLKHLCLKDFDSPFDYNENLYPEFE